MMSSLDFFVDSSMCDTCHLNQIYSWECNFKAGSWGRAWSWSKCSDGRGASFSHPATRTLPSFPTLAKSAMDARCRYCFLRHFFSILKEDLILLGSRQRQATLFYSMYRLIFIIIKYVGIILHTYVNYKGYCIVSWDWEITGCWIFFWCFFY